MKKVISLILAFITAPAVGATVFTIWFAGDLDVEEVLLVLLAAFVFASIITVVLGVPMYWLLSRYWRVTWRSSSAAGMVLGIVGANLIRGYGSGILENNAVMSVIGAISGMVFWVVLRFGRSGEV